MSSKAPETSQACDLLFCFDNLQTFFVPGVMGSPLPREGSSVNADPIHPCALVGAQSPELKSHPCPIRVQTRVGEPPKGGVWQGEEG